MQLIDFSLASRPPMRLGGVVAAALLLALLPTGSTAQFVQRPKLVPAAGSGAMGFAGSGEGELVLEEGEQALELLQNATLDFNSAVTKANINALSYYAKIGAEYYPFYVFTSFPVLTPNRDDLEAYLANEVLNQFGGLLNATVAKQWHYLHDGRPGQEGLTLNLIGGGKLLEVVGLVENDYSPAAHVGGDAEMRIWLTSDRNTTDLAGLIHLRGAVLANYVGGDGYRDLFAASGEEPTSTPITASLSGRVHVFDQFYLSGGWVASFEDRLPDRTFFAVSVNRR